MVTAVVILTLLTVVASLASWLFGQWLGARPRISGAALAIGGGGVTLLVGAVAFVMIGATTGWQRFVPTHDSSPLIAPAPVAAQPANPVSAEPTAEKAAAQHQREQKAEMVETAERHLRWSDYAKAVDVASQYLAEHPGDPEMSSLLARSLFAAEHPGPASIIPAAVVAQWPSTNCIAPLRSDESSRWILDNGCGRVVAVLFASCQSSETACFTNAVVSQGWSYEPAGILMTAANDKPVPLRLRKDGPLVAPIFTIRDPAGARRQIRYLACDVTAPGVLELLRTSAGDEERLAAELRVDACYAQVLDWSRSGQRLGRSPDALLRQGID